MNNNKSIKETLLESKDRSSLDNNFKLKKLDDKIEFVKFPSDKAIKYMRNNNRLNDEDFINYYKKTRVGELAIDKTNGQVAGYIFVNKQKKVIGPLRVDENYRGMGISNILIEDAVSKFGGDNLGVYSDNEVAIKLYKSHGFKVYGSFIYKGDEVLKMKHKKYIARGKSTLKEKSVMTYNTILPCFTPKEMEELGVFSNIAEENHYNVVTDHKYHDNYVYYLSTGEVLPEYIYNLREAYEEYMKDKSNTNKQSLLELGWNPEVSLSDKAIMESSRLTKDRLTNDGYKPLEIIDLTK